MKGAQKHSARELTIPSCLGMVKRADLADLNSIQNTTESHDPPCFVDYQQSRSLFTQVL